MFKSLTTKSQVAFALSKTHFSIVNHQHTKKSFSTSTSKSPSRYHCNPHTHMRQSSRLHHRISFSYPLTHIAIDNQSRESPPPPRKLNKQRAAQLNPFRTRAIARSLAAPSKSISPLYTQGPRDENFRGR